MSNTFLHAIYWKWMIAFFLSLMIELPIYALLGKKYGPVFRCLLAGTLGTLVTHPLLWFVWRHVFDNYLLYVATGELVVCIVEGVIFFAVVRPISLSKALAIAFFANATSYGIGVLLRLLHLL